jgi:hypothetical protein
MGTMRNALKFWSGCLRGREHSEDRGVNGKLILKWILDKLTWMVSIGFMWLMTCCCEDGNEPSGAVKGREFLD